MSKLYDLIILGAGPAGLAAGLYAGRSRLSTLIIEKGQDGGQISITNDIENYPGGKADGESGPELMARFTQQCARFGAERLSATVSDVELEGDVKKITCTDGSVYEARTVILATGANPRKIGCPGEAEFSGKGVSYCATCDANFFQDLEVYVVGGGDAAVEEAMYLCGFARKVHLIHRRDQLRAAASIQERAFRTENLDFIWDSVVDHMEGDGVLQRLVLKNVKTGELTNYDADEDDGLIGCFVFVGFNPTSSLFVDKVESENGYVLTDAEMRTNVPGVFAAGDVRKKTLRQVITAAADGAQAAVSAEKYLAEKK